MKHEVTYLPHEEAAAMDAKADLMRKYPGAKVHKSASKPPVNGFYLRVKIPGNDCGGGGSA